MRRLLLLLALSCAPASEESAVASSSSQLHEGFTYEDLVDLIRSQHLTSIEQVLPALPESYRASYALMYESRSLQSASYTHPRVIMFGRDARLTCTFNGDTRQVGFDSLECIQFREAERAFDFRQIRFKNGHVEFSQRNHTTDGETKCTSCHGADPRPNWEAYDKWPGAYGFDDDALAGDVEHYATFVAHRAEHPRYRWLVQGSGPTDPYSINYALASMKRPNIRYSDLSGRMNALRATRLLEPTGQKLAWAIKALGCTSEGDLNAMFARVGIPGREWGMKIGNDPIAKPWEHQAGGGFLSISIGMTVAQDYANAGNVTLQQGLERIKAYFPTRYSGPDLVHRQVLNETVPDPDKFGGYFERNVAEICPELLRLKAASESR